MLDVEQLNNIDNFINHKESISVFKDIEIDFNFDCLSKIDYPTYRYHLESINKYLNLNRENISKIALNKNIDIKEILNKNNRFCFGAIYGLLIGDALGQPLEFTKKTYHNQQIENFQIGYDKNKIYSFKAGDFTDDGSMALCNLVSIHSAFKDLGIDFDTEKLLINSQNHQLLFLNTYMEWYFSGFLSSIPKAEDCGNSIKQNLHHFANILQENPDNQESFIPYSKNILLSYPFQQQKLPDIHPLGSPEIDLFFRSANGALMKQSTITALLFHYFTSDKDKKSIIENNQLLKDILKIQSNETTSEHSDFKFELFKQYLESNHEFQTFIDYSNHYNIIVNRCTHRSLITDYTGIILNMLVSFNLIANYLGIDIIHEKQKYAEIVLELIFSAVQKDLNFIQSKNFRQISLNRFVNFNNGITNDIDTQIKELQDFISFFHAPLKEKTKNIFQKLLKRENVSKQNKTIFPILKTDYSLLKNTGYAIDTLKNAIHCFYYSNDFIDSIIMSINLREDSDTVAAVTGQIAGSFYGMENIIHSKLSDKYRNCEKFSEIKSSENYYFNNLRHKELVNFILFNTFA